eukprot:520673-Hanusia_phi.AAC.2
MDRHGSLAPNSTISGPVTTEPCAGETHLTTDKDGGEAGGGGSACAYACCPLEPLRRRYKQTRSKREEEEERGGSWEGERERLPGTALAAIATHTARILLHPSYAPRPSDPT